MLIRRLCRHAYLRPLRRRDEETRWGVCTATPPDLPEGRAVGYRKALRGLAGSEEENRAGAVVWYLARAVIRIDSLQAAQAGGSAQKDSENRYMEQIQAITLRERKIFMDNVECLQ